MRKHTRIIGAVLGIVLLMPIVSYSAERYDEPRVLAGYIQPEAVKVKWDYDTHVDHYRLRLFKGEQTKKLVHTYKKIGDATHRDITKDLEPNTTYAVRLKAYFKNGTESRYSPKVQFTTAPPPNVILIVSDDQRYDTTEFMPNLSALAAEGTTYTAGYVTTPLCCPSRSSILSGQYAHNHGVLNNTSPYGFEAFDDSASLATWLHDAGYSTALIGKYLNGYNATAGTYIPPGWDNFIAFASGDHYYDYTLTEYINGIQATNSSYGSDEAEYSTDVLLDRSLQFLAGTEANDDQPFFLYFTPFAPHSPMTAAPRHEDLYSTLADYTGPALNEADVTDKTGFVSTLDELTETELLSIMATRRRTADSLQAVDEALASMTAALQTYDEADNTIIIYIGDNGYHWGEHRIASGKSTPYEESIHVPFIVYDPIQPIAQTRDELVLNIDLAPTILDYANIAIPTTVDGQSFKDIQTGDTPSWRTDFLTESWTDAGNADPFTAVHAGDQVYVAFSNGAEELYDLPTDPYQLTNLSSSSDYADLLASFRARLSVLTSCVGAEQCQ